MATSPASAFIRSISPPHPSSPSSSWFSSLHPFPCGGILFQSPCQLSHLIYSSFTTTRSPRLSPSTIARRRHRGIMCSSTVAIDQLFVVRIHYHRPDGLYDGWQCRAESGAAAQTTQVPEVGERGEEEFGVFWDVAMKDKDGFKFVVHKSGLEDCKGSASVDHTDVWVISDVHDVFPERPDLFSFMKDNLSFSRAFWVTKSLIAWNMCVNNACYYIYASRRAKLQLTRDGVEGHDTRIRLEPVEGKLPLNVATKFPHIADYKAFKITSEVDVEELLKAQLAIICLDANGRLVNATGLQLPGVLDDLFSYEGPLGAVIAKDTVALYLWAPTAQAVQAYIFGRASDDIPLETVDLVEMNGVWFASGPRTWEGCYYVYKLTVFHSSTMKIETCFVNDPYAKGLSADGKKTLIVNLNSDNLKPAGWDRLAEEKPNLSSFSDISIYELHIRDFSANDKTVNLDLRGGYLAFTLQDSAGFLHLNRLSKAGLTHIHLLPSFHFAGVDDNKKKWKHLDEERLASLPPDSELQQAHVVAIQEEDGYNWGYNPVLWGVPKGSYASNPDGPLRTLEFRKMVQALNHIGLRVVLDVVYNHVHGSGPHDNFSVLDKVVPGYYLRRNADGHIEHSTCTNNTASEHYMVERLIIDDLLHWALQYKVDGFRFDLMGHIMKSTMLKARERLNSLSKDNDGVDGSKIYIYGEGWDFGEVSKNARGTNASQFNMCGTGIGSFNDRIRDAILGGSPFGPVIQQGFSTGLLLQPNEHVLESENSDHILAVLKDHIQVKGSEVLTHDGVPVAFALSPTETVNYVSAHDNETLFDAISLKTSVEISVSDRCRLNHLATSLVALSQGIPFFHSGDEMLRSKSLDRDSYNSGDWFNRLDFSYESNNWGIGLPPKEKNERNWPLIKSRLANASFKPQKIHILSAVENFEDVLRIRYSSPLFRLRTANEIQERVRFHNCGPSWVRGVIVMSIEDGYSGMPGMTQMDPLYSFIVIVFNACPSNASFSIPSLRRKKLELHPLQLMSSDKVVKNSFYEATSGSFSIPARTTSVFVEVRAI
ncbi:pullulanase 1, chloroplastic isoform X2 [Nymphaea colorata]|uniref:pullulanase 1, chloroplastic isoform X2 n=1 Tax=Nymphaea colorata TaxID=210225 RepID=UPI00129D845D|nr:pullulanase 1, chloroplastic isoform X2 [Nymphaea colorata]